jgi:hypothetical protein
MRDVAVVLERIPPSSGPAALLCANYGDEVIPLSNLVGLPCMDVADSDPFCVFSPSVRARNRLGKSKNATM